jgi:energy-coupling factor transport system substrate-specific component
MRTIVNNKLKAKDLINVGIFTAIYFVVMGAGAILGVIPIFMPLNCATVPIVGGIPFILFLTRVRKFGMIFIMSILLGILLLLTGMGYYPLLVGIVSGLIAEFVYKSGEYKSASKAVLTSGVYSFMIWGNMILLHTNKDAYFTTRQNFGQEYIDTLTNLTPVWMLPVLLIVTFVCGLIGGLLGRVLLKKHFAKAGIA